MRQSLELIVELYRRGNYDMLKDLGMFDKQLTALERLNDNLTTEVLYGGAARGGKSWLGCTWQIMNRLAMPGSYGMIAREELTKLKDTTQKTFWKVMAWLGAVEGVDYYWHSGRQEVEFINGSSIIFRELKYKGSNDPEFDRIGSYDLTDAFIDEAQQIHWKARDVLRGRFSVLRGEYEVNIKGEIQKRSWRVKPKAYYSCNPAKNWIYTDFFELDKNRVMPKNRAFIPSLPSDNPYVSQDYLDNLKESDKITRERLLYGNFDYDDDPNSLCSWDAICDIFNNDHVKEASDRYLVADLAMLGRDKFVVMYWEGLAGRIRAVEGKITGKEIEEKLREIKTADSVPNRRIIADSDGLGQYLSSYLNNIREFHGGDSSIDKQFGNKKDECGFKLAELIREGGIRIVCDNKEHQEEIKRQLSICLKRKVNVDDEKKRLMKKSEMKEKLGYSPDFLDVLLMRMDFIVEPEFNPLV